MLTGGISGPGTSSPPHRELRQVTVGARPLAHTASLSALLAMWGQSCVGSSWQTSSVCSERWGLCSEGLELREKLGAQQPGQGPEPKAAALPWPAVNLGQLLTFPDDTGSRWKEGPALSQPGPVRSLGLRCLSHTALRRAVPPRPSPPPRAPGFWTLPPETLVSLMLSWIVGWCFSPGPSRCPGLPGATACPSSALRSIGALPSPGACRDAGCFCLSHGRLLRAFSGQGTGVLSP